MGTLGDLLRFTSINTGLHGYCYPHFWKKRRKIVNLFSDNSSPYAKNSKKAMR